MAEKSYVIRASKEYKPCNVIDKWDGVFRFNIPVRFPCDCLTYTGDLQLAQEMCWPNPITADADFEYELVCECGVVLYRGVSARGTQKHSAWANLIF
jgi:hypothetical protein